MWNKKVRQYRPLLKKTKQIKTHWTTQNTAGCIIEEHQTLISYFSRSVYAAICRHILGSVRTGTSRRRSVFIVLLSPSSLASSSTPRSSICSSVVSGVVEAASLHDDNRMWCSTLQYDEAVVCWELPALRKHKSKVHIRADADHDSKCKIQRAVEEQWKTMVVKACYFHTRGFNSNECMVTVIWVYYILIDTVINNSRYLLICWTRVTQQHRWLDRRIPASPCWEWPDICQQFRGRWNVYT